MIENLRKEQIAYEAIKTLFTRFENFPEDSSSNRNAPFHEAFLNAFSDKLEGKVTDIPTFISLSSWFHGVNTTLGQSFFENVAHILSNGYKKPYTAKSGSLLKVSRSQKEVISDIVTDLKNDTQTPSLNRENNLLFNTRDTANLEANSFTVDVYIEAETQIIGVELKSVKPNAGEMRGEKQKILEAKAALHNTFTEKELHYFIGFPFDPTSETPTGYNKQRFLNSIIDGIKYFALDEVLLASELWDFLSDDENTMDQILEIVNTIATPEFQDKYNYLNNNEKRLNDKTNYKNQLNQWFLYNEARLLNNNKTILRRLANNQRGIRKYNQPIFKGGEYNTVRRDFLKDLLVEDVGSNLS